MRCGQCMHVFNAKEQIAENSTATAHQASSITPSSAWPSIQQEPLVEIEIPAPVADGQPQAALDDTIAFNTANNPFELMTLARGTDADDHGQDATVSEQIITHERRPRRWAWLLAVGVLCLAALLQGTYYLRDQIAITFPQLKPFLEQACAQINCTISLPQHIELITIDDSDMHEDENYAGLIQLSSTLINKATFNQAYPNLELTLTNTDDEAILRKVFTPHEYLPAGKDVSLGFTAGEEIKIKLPITTQNTPVAGYRLYVTY